MNYLLHWWGHNSLTGEGDDTCTHDHNCRFGGCEGDSHLMVSILSVRLDVGQLLRGRGEIVRFKENKDD